MDSVAASDVVDSPKYPFTPVRGSTKALRVSGHTDGRMLQIYTLGQFCIRFASDPIVDAVVANHQVRMLLKCLVSAPRYSLSREQICEALWPEQDAMQARDALRQSLSRLRRTLEPHRHGYQQSLYVRTDREMVWLALQNDSSDFDDIPTAPIWVDREAFEYRAQEAVRLLARDQPLTAHEQGYFCGQEAISLYRGHFLPMHSDIDWAQATQARCQRLWSMLMRALADFEVARGCHDAAILCMGHVVDAMPDDENAAARLMALLAANGHRGEALRAFDALCKGLAKRLGASPTQEVRRLADAIRSSSSQRDLLALL